MATPTTMAARVTISGGWSGWWDDLDGSRILRIGGASTDVMLRDLTLAHGFAHEASGGAVQLNGGTLALTGSTVRDSQAGSDGFGEPGRNECIGGKCMPMSVVPKRPGEGLLRVPTSVKAIAASRAIAYSWQSVSPRARAAGVAEASPIDRHLGITL